MSPQEVAAALFGLSRVLRLDPAGLAAFDDRPQAVWNSFKLAFVIAPVYLIQAAVVWAGQPESLQGVAAWRFFVLELIGYALGWLVFPLAMLHVTRWMDRAERWGRFVVAYNWLQLLIGLILLPIVLINATGLLPQGALTAVLVMAGLAFLVYDWFIARTALALTGVGAAGIVVLDLVLTWLVDRAATPVP